MLAIEVHWYFLNDWLAYFRFRYYLSTGVHDLYLASPKEGFTIQLELLAHFFINGSIQAEEYNLSAELVHPTNMRSSLFKAFWSLASLGLCLQPILHRVNFLWFVKRLCIFE